MEPTRPPGDPGPEADLTDLTTARSAAEAQVIAAVLSAAGIPVFVGGSALQDEFAVSQRLLNVQQVRVQVRRDQVAQAQEALQAARSVAAADLEAEALAAAPAAAASRRPAAGQPTAPGGGRGWLTLLLGVLAVIFAGLWLSERRAREGDDPLYTVELRESGPLWRWRDSGRPAIEMRHATASTPAQTFHYNRLGERIATTIDGDGNGLPDTVVNHGPGDLELRWLDADQDGRFETLRIPQPDGSVRTFALQGHQGYVEQR